MQADDVAQVADELYSLLPGQFTSARDARARQARAAGQRDAAAAIGKLARPTVSAWLVNQLIRTAAEPMGRLFEVGEALHDAQRDLAGDRLRELSGQRRQVVSDLLAQAGRLAEGAGVPASTAAMDEVRGTLEAALADAEARAEVRAGRLTRPLAYAGLGDVDLSAALAAMPAARQPVEAHQSARPRRPGQPPDARRADVLAAEAAVTAAAEKAASAESRVTSLAEQQQFVGRRVEHLRHELGRAEEEEQKLARLSREAAAALEAAARALRRAERELEQARERGGPG